MPPSAMSTITANIGHEIKRELNAIIVPSATARSDTWFFAITDKASDKFQPDASPPLTTPVLPHEDMKEKWLLSHAHENRIDKTLHILKKVFPNISPRVANLIVDKGCEEAVETNEPVGRKIHALLPHAIPRDWTVKIYETPGLTFGYVQLQGGKYNNLQAAAVLELDPSAVYISKTPSSKIGGLTCRPVLIPQILYHQVNAKELTAIFETIHESLGTNPAIDGTLLCNLYERYSRYAYSGFIEYTLKRKDLELQFPFHRLPPHVWKKDCPARNGLVTLTPWQSIDEHFRTSDVVPYIPKIYNYNLRNRNRENEDGSNKRPNITQT
jgi:hypothetical protein